MFATVGRNTEPPAGIDSEEVNGESSFPLIPVLAGAAGLLFCCAAIAILICFARRGRSDADDNTSAYEPAHTPAQRPMYGDLPKTQETQQYAASGYTASPISDSSSQYAPLDTASDSAYMSAGYAASPLSERESDDVYAVGPLAL